MKKILLNLTVFILLLNCELYSQVDINNFTLSKEQIPLDTILNPSGNLISLKCTLEIPLELNLSKIYLKIGTSPGGSEIKNIELTPNLLSDPSTGILYETEDNRMILYLGDYPTTTYYLSAKLEDKDGNISTEKTN